MPEQSRFFNEAVEVTRQIMESNGSVTPTLLVDSPRGKLVLAFPMGDDDEKERIALVMRALLQRLAAEQYVLITEAWTVKGNEALSGIRPSQHASREEVVTFTHGHKDQDGIMGMCPIIREGKETRLGEVDVEASNSTGRLANLLDDEPLARLTGTQRRQIDKEVTKIIRKMSTTTELKRSLH